VRRSHRLKFVLALVEDIVNEFIFCYCLLVILIIIIVLVVPTDCHLC
jgi:hypothetical protein